MTFEGGSYFGCWKTAFVPPFRHTLQCSAGSRGGDKAGGGAKGNLDDLASNYFLQHSQATDSSVLKVWIANAYALRPGGL